MIMRKITYKAKTTERPDFKAALRQVQRVMRLKTRREALAFFLTS